MLSLDWSGSPAATGAGGVYVLWRSISGSCVYVGQADDLAERLRLHLTRWSVGFAPLTFAWAIVRQEERACVLRYLLQRYRPLQDSPWPNGNAQPVNLPRPGPRLA